MAREIFIFKIVLHVISDLLLEAFHFIIVVHWFLLSFGYSEKSGLPYSIDKNMPNFKRRIKILGVITFVMEGNGVKKIFTLSMSWTICISGSEEMIVSPCDRAASRVSRIATTSHSLRPLMSLPNPSYTQKNQPV